MGAEATEAAEEELVDDEELKKGGRKRRKRRGSPLASTTARKFGRRGSQQEEVEEGGEVVDGENEQALRRAMRQALGKKGSGGGGDDGEDVRFRSIQQERAMRAVLAGQSPLVVILPTGAGKSLLFMVPACMQDPGVTVVVVPFIALLQDVVGRLRRAGIDCLEWRPGEVNPAAVVVVSADAASDRSFLQYTTVLAEQRMLRRVFVDECHLALTSSDWRPKLARLGELRALGCQMVLLTATLPPALETDLAEAMMVHCAAYIRESTVRPGIRYMVQRSRPEDMFDAAVALCRR